MNSASEPTSSSCLQGFGRTLWSGFIHLRFWLGNEGGREKRRKRVLESGACLQFGSSSDLCC